MAGICHRILPIVYISERWQFPPQEGGKVLDNSEMIMIDFPLEPQPKLRPRFHIYRGRVLTQTPLKTKVYENYVADWYTYHGGKKFDKGILLKVELEFYFETPKSYSKKKKAAAIAGEIRHVSKPDIDNLTKAALDALNDIAWHDDAQIIEIKSRKQYAKESHFIIKIYPVTEAGE